MSVICLKADLPFVILKFLLTDIFLTWYYKKWWEIYFCLVYTDAFNPTGFQCDTFCRHLDVCFNPWLFPFWMHFPPLIKKKCDTVVVAHSSESVACIILFYERWSNAYHLVTSVTLKGLFNKRQSSCIKDRKQNPQGISYKKYCFLLTT